MCTFWFCSSALTQTRPIKIKYKRKRGREWKLILLLPMLAKTGIFFGSSILLISPKSCYIYLCKHNILPKFHKEQSRKENDKIKKKLELNLVVGNLKSKRTEILVVYIHILCQVNVLCKHLIASFGET